MGCDRTAEPTSTTSRTTSSSGNALTASSAPSGAASTQSAPPPAAAAAPTEPPSGAPAPPDVAAAPSDATKTKSGLAYKVLQPGVGKERPSALAQVKVHYTGWTTDGHMFDSTSSRAEPAEFRVDGVIKGWTEGLQLMSRGQKMRFWIPAALAYGDTPRRPGMPAGPLVFDVELLEIVEPPAAPPDVKAPPPTAKRTDSGLAYRVLRKGTGTRHPTGTDRVRVHYTGWTTDGKVFDSSVMRGQPIGFALDRVIKGWTEGVQLMLEGEKSRFWIPAALAYGDNPGPGQPAGMLVFEIELLAIE